MTATEARQAEAIRELERCALAYLGISLAGLLLKFAGNASVDAALETVRSVLGDSDRTRN